MSEPDHTIIAGAKTCGEWRALRQELIPGGDSTIWASAFDDCVQTRLQSRYLRPIELIQAHDTQQGEGFAIVAIHCSLIEFLESSVQGLSYRYVKRDADLGPHEYRKSGKLFEAFLCTREPFRHEFDVALAKDFYKNIRCAVLHEARTKGWWIWADGPTIVDRICHRLYRNNFHDALLSFIKWYRGCLLSDAVIQAAFVRKFDSLCD